MFLFFLSRKDKSSILGYKFENDSYILENIERKNGGLKPLTEFINKRDRERKTGKIFEIFYNLYLDRYTEMPKPHIFRHGVLIFYSALLYSIYFKQLNLNLVTWRCPTLTWGSPTLPSTLQRFTSEFGMVSGGSTALSPPG